MIVVVGFSILDSPGNPITMGPKNFSSWLDITSGALSDPSAANDDSISARSSGFGNPGHKHSVRFITNYTL